MPVTKHTPGPWFIDGNVIRGDKQRNGSISIACTLNIAYPYGRWSGESEQANARLIAAAPELLEALQDMVDYYGTASASVEALHKARSAIAKATGGHPCQ